PVFSLNRRLTEKCGSWFRILRSRMQCIRVLFSQSLEWRYLVYWFASMCSRNSVTPHTDVRSTAWTDARNSEQVSIQNYSAFPFQSLDFSIIQPARGFFILSFVKEIRFEQNRSLRCFFPLLCLVLSLMRYLLTLISRNSSFTAVYVHIHTFAQPA